MDTLTQAFVTYALFWIGIGALMTAAEFIAGMDIGLRRNK